MEGPGCARTGEGTPDHPDRSESLYGLPGANTRCLSPGDVAGGHRERRHGGAADDGFGDLVANLDGSVSDGSANCFRSAIPLSSI
jgi:hypothetical protein